MPRFRPTLLAPLLLLPLGACPNGDAPPDELVLQAQVPDGNFGIFVEYDPVPVADVLADPTAFEGREAVLEGELLEVCSSSGCWFELGAAGEPGLMVLLRDGAGEIYGIPTDTTGRASASGKLTVEDGVPQLVARGVRLATD